MSIFEKYNAANNAAIALSVVEQLRPLLTRASSGVEQRLFDVEQAARYLGRSPEAVRLLIHRGKLPVTKIDGKVQIDRAALDKLITEATFYQV